MRRVTNRGERDHSSWFPSDSSTATLARRRPRCDHVQPKSRRRLPSSGTECFSRPTFRRCGLSVPAVPRDQAPSSDGSLEGVGWVGFRKSLLIAISWRRRESNPRPRPHRPSVYERSPGFGLARRDGSRTTTWRASHPSESRLGRLALPRRRARSLAPRPWPRAQPGGTSPYLVETRRRVRDRSSHLHCSRWINEADRGPRLATGPENRPRRNLVAPVCVFVTQDSRRTRHAPPAFVQ